MASRFFRRVGRASPIVFGGQGKSVYGGFRIPFGGIAAGSSYLYYCSSPNLPHLDEVKQETGPKIALNSDKWIPFKLQYTAWRMDVTHFLRFSFDPSTKLGLDTGSCILTRAPLGQDAEGKTKYVIRPYTPISDPDAKGYFDLLIRVYPEGKMSQHLASLKPGDFVEVKGPVEKLRYSPNMKKHIGVIAGGTGIIPMLQVIEAILKNPEDNTQVSLLYAINEVTIFVARISYDDIFLRRDKHANISSDDIRLVDKLNFLAASYPNFKVFGKLPHQSDISKGDAGYITRCGVRNCLPPPNDDTLILICGPPGMMKEVSGEKAKDDSQGEVSGILKSLGYTEQMVYKF